MRRTAALAAAILLLTLVGTRALAGEALPDPRAGGPGGKAVSILVLGTGQPIVDERYLKELTDAGYRVTTLLFGDYSLTLDYLKSFGVVILSGLPTSLDAYQVGGWRTAITLEPNQRALHAYVEAGGGLVFLPELSGFGRSLIDSYNEFLKPYDVRYLAQLLRHDALTQGAYAQGEIYGTHPISKGLQHLLYPIHVLRWDDAYANDPFVPGKAWTVLAAGKPGAGTFTAVDNSNVDPQQHTAERGLFAIRVFEKGLVAVSGIHRYYTLSHVYYNQENHLGENDTGLIDGIAMAGEKGGRPSDLGKLFDHTFRFLAANSARNGLGGGTDAEPAQPPMPQVHPAVDWHTQQPPPTWRHRVIPGPNWRIFDEYPDPAVQGELKYFKALVGPRTALGGGHGTVREYRDAAVRAGYSAVLFAERIEDSTPEKFDYLVADCKSNSDDTFVCLPGLDIEDSQGNRYLILGAERWPDPAWMTPDGKRIVRTNMFSLGWGHRKLTSVHRPGRTPLHPMMYKHYEGITVFTYDAAGKLIDDGLHAYQWAVSSDSNPVPIVAHELDSPDQVARAAESGFQQIVPATSIAQGIDYFRHALAHYFDCPARYFITEGPILDGWSIFNKDIADAADGRDHYRMGIGVTADDPIADVTLYDGFDVARCWSPNAKEFRQTVDGWHDGQHQYMLIARDAKGRRVLSPQIRTVVRNYRARCADRQNWVGTMPDWCIYTGWRQAFGHFSLAFVNAAESPTQWNDLCPIYDYPFFSNHAAVVDTDLSTKYVNATEFGGDAKPTFAVRPTDLIEMRVRTTHFAPTKRKDIALLLVETTLRLKRDVQPRLDGLLYPVAWTAPQGSDLLILPDGAPEKLANQAIASLPVGSYVGGMIPLTEGLRLQGRQVGFPAPSPDTLVLPKGTTWTARYFLLNGKPFRWSDRSKAAHVDPNAEQALAQMGFRGTPPYALKLTQGKLDRLAGFAELSAEGGGVAGRCENPKGQELLFFVTLRIHGLNPHCQSALWRSGQERLDYFACFGDTGYVFLDADKSADFYAGSVASCDPALFVSVVIWNANEAWFRVNNPTRRDITTEFATAPGVRGFKPLRKTITVKAGASIDIQP